MSQILAERNVMPKRGARFFREAGEVRFEFVIDASNILGPREATEADQAKHPEAWAAFCAGEGIKPLDRDASGADGGSLKHEPAPKPKRTPKAKAATTPKPKGQPRRRKA